MSGPATRRSLAWILVAHTAAAAALGALEAARLGSATLALALVPVFAATGLVAGSVIAATERAHAVAAARWPRMDRWWATALVLAAPTLLISVPVGRTLFQGAFAQTLPLAGAAPVLLPVAAWGGGALALAVGRRVGRAPDLTTRAILVLACAGAIGAVTWVTRHVLHTGYADAHVGAALVVIVLAGIAVRVTRRAPVSPYVAAVVVALVGGTALASALDGLGAPADRRRLATAGDAGRHLVRLWRGLVDRDGDGSSPLLGGGDCDDGDAARHPGAPDRPADGVDQDCDGTDPAPPPPAAAPPAPLALAAWRNSAPVQAVLARTRTMNVLVITVDALRFDVLAPDAADRAEFPHLTQLLADAVWFPRAIAPGAGTDIALGTLLSGRLDPFQRIDTTLPEALRDAGFHTSSALPEEVYRYVGETLLSRGMTRAKHVYTDWDQPDVGDHVSGPTTTNEGLRALDDAGPARAFTWVHYFDVHEHHQIDVPAELRAKVSGAAEPRRHTYRALLVGIDAQVGRLRAELTRRGLADRTIIVFASDHGESLGEDPRLGETHGKVAYGALVRIPLAIHIPGVPGGLRADAATLVDLAPTLLGLLGVPPAGMTLDGVDLVPALLDAPAALRPAVRALVTQEELQWGVVEWPFQLLVRPAEDVVELYDLAADPAQRRELAALHPDVVTRLRARYAEVPTLRLDRSSDGRRWRERQAQPPPRRALR